MSVFTKLGVNVAAPFNADGTPRQISPQDFQIWMTEVERLVKVLLAGVGGIDLPELIYKYIITGGDENNIKAKPNAEVTAAAGEALFTIDITEPNTSDVRINGKPLLTSSGNQVVAGGLVPGIWLFLDDGSNFRLVSDQSGQAIVNAAENALLHTHAAQDAAEAARDVALNAASDVVSQGTVPIYSTRNAVEGMEIPSAITAFRTNGYAVPGDGGAALYKRVALEPPHAGKVQSADGVWWELTETNPNVKMFGGVGDGLVVDQTAIAAAVGYAYDNKAELYWPEGDYVSTANIPYLHSIRHRGNGRIKAGNFYFHLLPTAKQLNTVFYDETGSPDNDGLHPTRRIDTLSVAYDAVFSNRRASEGKWKFFRSDARIVALTNGEFVQPTVVQLPSDFPHLEDAFNFLRKHKVAYNNLISVRMQVGYSLTRGVAFRYDDFSRVEIVSDDAVVPVDASFVGVNITTDLFEANSLLVAFQTKAPRLNCLIDMRMLGGCGVVMTDNSDGYIAGNKGVRSAGAFGLYVKARSSCIAANADFRLAGWGNRVTTNSLLQAPQCNFSQARNATYLETNNVANLDVSRGSIAYVTGTEAARTNLQGGKGYGLAVRRSFVSATHVDCSQNERSGVNAGAGSVIAFGGSRVSSCLLDGIASDGARIDANSTTVINNGRYNLYADSGAEITARSVICGGAGINSVRAANGSRINISGGSCRRGTADDPADIVVGGGSIIHAAGATGGTNITALSLNVAGIIFK